MHHTNLLASYNALIDIFVFLLFTICAWIHNLICKTVEYIDLRFFFAVGSSDSGGAGCFQGRGVNERIGGDIYLLLIALSMEQKTG